MNRGESMKSKMFGAVHMYRKMLDIVRDWDESAAAAEQSDGNESGHYLDTIDWELSDAPYHGWSGDALASEYDIYHDVQAKYRAFKTALLEAAGGQ